MCVVFAVNFVWAIYIVWHDKRNSYCLHRIHLSPLTFILCLSLCWRAACCKMSKMISVCVRERQKQWKTASVCGLIKEQQQIESTRGGLWRTAHIHHYLLSLNTHGYTRTRTHKATTHAMSAPDLLPILLHTQSSLKHWAVILTDPHLHHYGDVLNCSSVCVCVCVSFVSLCVFSSYLSCKKKTKKAKVCLCVVSVFGWSGAPIGRTELHQNTLRWSFGWDRLHD